MPIRLYDLAGRDPEVRFSPYCWRTRMALLHKGLAFDALPWRFSDKAVLAPSGQARVPVIVDGDRWVNDSWTIALYLDERYPDRPPLMRNEAERTAARLVAVWAETALHMAAFPLVVVNIWQHLDPKDQPYFRESREQRFGRKLESIVTEPKAAIEGLMRALAPAEAALQMAPFLGGAEPTYADYALYGSLAFSWVAAPIEPIGTDTAVGRWFQGMMGRFDGAARPTRLMRAR